MTCLFKTWFYLPSFLLLLIDGRSIVISGSVSDCMSVCLYVCRPMSVCPLAFLKNRMSKFSNLNTLPVAVARSSFNDSAIQYALLVLWMTSCFHIMGPLDQNQAWLCFVKFARWRHRVRCPMSTIALFKGVFDYRIRIQIHTEKRKQKQLLQSKTLSLTVWIRIRLL